MTIRKLTRAGTTGVYHIVDDERVGGPHAGLRGNVTGLCGDVNACGLTDADRAAGVDVEALVAEQEAQP